MKLGDSYIYLTSGRGEALTAKKRKVFIPKIIRNGNLLIR